MALIRPFTNGEASPAYGRYEAPEAQALTSAQVFLSSGWDSDASFTIDSGSNDQRGTIRVTAGTTPGSNPDWTLIYGQPWVAAPFAIVMREGAGAQPVNSTNATMLDVTQPGVISSLGTIVYHYMVI